MCTVHLCSVFTLLCLYVCPVYPCSVFTLLRLYVCPSLSMFSVYTIAFVCVSCLSMFCVYTIAFVYVSCLSMFCACLRQPWKNHSVSSIYLTSCLKPVPTRIIHVTHPLLHTQHPPHTHTSILLFLSPLFVPFPSPPSPLYISWVHIVGTNKHIQHTAYIRSCKHLT